MEDNNLTASTSVGPAASSTKSEDYTTINPTDVFGQLLALKDSDLVNIRNKERALHGSEEVVSFYGSVPQSGALVLVSNLIAQRFAILEIEAIFESAAEDLQVSFLVSNDSNAAATGFNILSDFSPQPYFSGNSATVKAKPNPKEFASGQYLKVSAINSNSGAAVVLNARIRIKVYPIIPQSN